MNPILKFIGLTVLMYGCVLFGISRYHMGFISDIFMWLIAVGLAAAAFFLTRKLWELIFLYVNLLVSVFISGKCMTYLYYTNISSDDMSLILGEIFTLIGTGFAFIVACAGITVKAILISKKKKKELKADKYFHAKEEVNIVNKTGKYKKIMLRILTYIGLLILIYSCALFGIKFFHLGVIIGLTIILISLASTFCVFLCINRVWEMVLLYVNLLVAVVIGEISVTQLYYHNISSDQMTLVIGDVTLFTAFITTIAACCLFINIKRKSQMSQEQKARYALKGQTNLHKTDLNIKKNWFLFLLIYGCCFGAVLYKFSLLAYGFILALSLVSIVMIYKSTNKAYDLLFWNAQLVFSVITSLRIIAVINSLTHERIYSQLNQTSFGDLFESVLLAEVITACTVLFTVRAVKLKKEEARLIDEYIEKNPNN